MLIFLWHILNDCLQFLNKLDHVLQILGEQWYWLEKTPPLYCFNLSSYIPEYCIQQDNFFNILYQFNAHYLHHQCDGWKNENIGLLCFWKPSFQSNFLSLLILPTLYEFIYLPKSMKVFSLASVKIWWFWIATDHRESQYHKVKVTSSLKIILSLQNSLILRSV